MALPIPNDDSLLAIAYGKKALVEMNPAPFSNPNKYHLMFSLLIEMTGHFAFSHRSKVLLLFYILNWKKTRKMNDMVVSSFKYLLPIF